MSGSGRAPLYPRVLRLRHVHPNSWQRAAFGEGAVAVAAVLVLADVATAWTLLVLPVAVAVVVKAHDVVAGTLARGAGSVPARGQALGAASAEAGGAAPDDGATVEVSTAGAGNAGSAAPEGTALQEERES